MGTIPMITAGNSIKLPSFRSFSVSWASPAEKSLHHGRSARFLRWCRPEGIASEGGDCVCTLAPTGCKEAPERSILTDEDKPLLGFGKGAGTVREQKWALARYARANRD